MKKLKDYKRICANNRNSYREKKFDIIEKSLHNPKLFCANWKNCSENSSKQLSSLVSGEKWFNHFSNLHSHATSNDTLVREDDTTYSQDVILNQPFTKKEFETAIKALKNGKACGVGMIRFPMKC